MNLSQQTSRWKKKTNQKLLRVIEHSKAAVEESSTTCTREGPAWQIGSFSALSCVAMGPKDCFALLQLGQAGRAASFSGPAPFPSSAGSVLSPQCFHWLGFDLYLLSWNCPSADLLSVAVFPCFPCFLNIPLVSLRNISGKKTASGWPEGPVGVWALHTSVCWD